jgi:hypothetical protein
VCVRQNLLDLVLAPVRRPSLPNSELLGLVSVIHQTFDAVDVIPSPSMLRRLSRHLEQQNLLPVVGELVTHMRNKNQALARDFALAFPLQKLARKRGQAVPIDSASAELYRSPSKAVELRAQILSTDLTPTPPLLVNAVRILGFGRSSPSDAAMPEATLQMVLVSLRRGVAKTAAVQEMVTEMLHTLTGSDQHQLAMQLLDVALAERIIPTQALVTFSRRFFFSNRTSPASIVHWIDEVAPDRTEEKRGKKKGGGGWGARAKEGWIEKGKGK